MLTIVEVDSTVASQVVCSMQLRGDSLLLCETSVASVSACARFPSTSTDGSAVGAEALLCKDWRSIRREFSPRGLAASMPAADMADFDRPGRSLGRSLGASASLFKCVAVAADMIVKMLLLGLSSGPGFSACFKLDRRLLLQLASFLKPRKVALYTSYTAQEWNNRTVIGHEPLICSKMCFTQTT